MKNLKLEIFAYIILCVVFAFAIVLMAISWANSQASNQPEEVTITENITTDLTETILPVSPTEPEYCYFRFVGEIDSETERGKTIFDELSSSYNNIIFRVIEIKGYFEEAEYFLGDELYFVEYLGPTLPSYMDVPFKPIVSLYNASTKEIIVRDILVLVQQHLKVLFKPEVSIEDWNSVFCYWRASTMYMGINNTKENQYCLLSMDYDVNNKRLWFKYQEQGMGLRPIEEQPLQPVG